jgi:hypothetical protein
MQRRLAVVTWQWLRLRERERGRERWRERERERGREELCNGNWWRPSARLGRT